MEIFQILEIGTNFGDLYGIWRFQWAAYPSQGGRGEGENTAGNSKTTLRGAAAVHARQLCICVRGALAVHFARVARWLYINVRGAPAVHFEKKSACVARWLPWPSSIVV